MLSKISLPVDTRLRLRKCFYGKLADRRIASPEIDFDRAYRKDAVPGRTTMNTYR